MPQATSAVRTTRRNVRDKRIVLKKKIAGAKTQASREAATKAYTDFLFTLPRHKQKRDAEDALRSVAAELAAANEAWEQAFEGEGDLDAAGQALIEINARHLVAEQALQQLRQPGAAALGTLTKGAAS